MIFNLFGYYNLTTAVRNPFVISYMTSKIVESYILIKINRPNPPIGN